MIGLGVGAGSYILNLFAVCEILHCSDVFYAFLLPCCLFDFIIKIA